MEHLVACKVVGHLWAMEACAGLASRLQTMEITPQWPSGGGEREELSFACLS